MANHTCPTCGNTRSSIHRREPGERFYENFSVTSSGCWEWQRARQGAGYGVFTAAPRVQMLAHRYSFALHNGHLDPDLLVCHSCDNPPCVNPNHLRLGTLSDNMQDSLRRNRRTLIGPPQKLDVEKVQIIRRLSEQGVVHRVLADTFGVSPATISQVVLRRVWKHVA